VCFVVLTMPWIPCVKCVAHGGQNCQEVDQSVNVLCVRVCGWGGGLGVYSKISME